MSSFILRCCIRVSQNLEVNLVSRSQMIDSGSPVCGNMWVKYRSAISSPVALVLVGHASIHPLKQSLYTKTRGRPASRCGDLKRASSGYIYCQITFEGST